MEGNNIISNAIRHTPNKGKICLHLSSGLFSIENEGQPIKEEHLSLIWTSFFREKEIIEQEKGQVRTCYCASNIKSTSYKTWCM